VCPCLRSFCELSAFVIEAFWSSMRPRAGGCLTAQADAKQCARMFLRAYLALHPHARLCFLCDFPCFADSLCRIEEILGIGSGQFTVFKELATIAKEVSKTEGEN
jgi:hypothetical protein